jgi:hypothetical protein
MSRRNAALSATEPSLAICRKSSAMLAAIAAASLRTMSLSHWSAWRVSAATSAGSAVRDAAPSAARPSNGAAGTEQRKMAKAIRDLSFVVMRKL